MSARRDVRVGLAIHGGAGAIAPTSDPATIAAYEAGLHRALDAGCDRLADGAAALDAVEAAVLILEDDPLFNAGRGAVLNATGAHELDAAVMGGDGRCGAVSALTDRANPVAVARRLLERGPAVHLTGAGAAAFAAAEGFAAVANDWFTTDRRRTQLEAARASGGQRLDHDDAVASGDGSTGTVGAVALDRAGHLAAATSTGGMTNKPVGRVGDSPLIGAGTWARDGGVAISCTGKGELFIRHAVAHEIDARVRLGGLDLEAVVRAVLDEELPPASGGLIAIDAEGRICLHWTTAGMYRGWARPDGSREVGIW